MLLNEIKEKVLSGELTLERRECGTRSKRVRVYSNTKGEYIEFPKWDKKQNKAVMVNKFFPDIESYKRVIFPYIRFEAKINDFSGYRISKKVYITLMKCLEESKKAI